jgi:hypothetical protein
MEISSPKPGLFLNTVSLKGIITAADHRNSGLGREFPRTRESLTRKKIAILLYPLEGAVPQRTL